MSTAHQQTATRTRVQTYLTHTACRSCAALALAPVISLGDQAISDFPDSTKNYPTSPLELVLCDIKKGGCGLVQLKHTADKNILYRNYWYRSGVNQTMRNALADITDKAEQLISLSEGDIVLDIGSNDNTLLRSYQASNTQKIGFEPATNLMPYAQDPDITVVNDYFAAKPFLNITHDKRAHIITSIAMFYDLEDPNAFVADIVHSLHPEGLWIIQMAYLPSMLKLNMFDNICHEHLEYYSLLSLESLLERHKLNIIDVSLNDINGGSFRIYITHAANEKLHPFPDASDRLHILRAQEHALRLTQQAPYQEFAQRVEHLKRECVDFIQQEVARGKIVYVYGASTKGNTLLQYYKLDHTVITAAAERNPDKWGKRTVATNIPIISENEARAAKPDYFLVLPWHFLSEFQHREQAFLRSGGKFIVPLPTFKIVGSAPAKAN